MDEKEAEARPLMGTIFLIYILLVSEQSERDTLRSVQSRIADIYIIYSTCKFCSYNP